MREPKLSAPARTRPRAIVLLLHGGSDSDERSVHPLSLPWWRMRLLRHRLAGELRGNNVDVRVLRHRVRGWNHRRDALPDPVTDARWALDALHREHPGVPIALVGHSMGGRTAVAVADDPAVWLVVGLAPWWPSTLTVDTLRGRDILGAHGAADAVTSYDDTRAYLRRARSTALSETFVDMGDSGHALMRHPREWADVVVAAVVRHSEAKDRAAAA